MNRATANRLALSFMLGLMVVFLVILHSGTWPIILQTTRSQSGLTKPVLDSIQHLPASAEATIESIDKLVRVLESYPPGPISPAEWESGVAPALGNLNRHVMSLQDRIEYSIVEINKVVTGNGAQSDDDKALQPALDPAKLLVHNRDLTIRMAQSLDTLYRASEKTASMRRTIEDLRGRPPESRPDSRELAFTVYMALNDQALESLWATQAAADSFQSTDMAASLFIMTTYVWLSLFYSIIVLFPSLLLLLFLYRKRDNRLAQILTDLNRLDPNGFLLKRISRQDDEQPDGRKGRPAGRIEEQAFNNFEYFLSTLLLTSLLLVGWYFVFYPKAASGLISAVNPTEGARDLSRYLSDYLMPVTLGFVGAYFFMVVSLTRRYLAADLYPAALLQAAARLLVVFTISLALSIAAPLLEANVTHNADSARNTIAVLSFFAGIFPVEVLQTVASWLGGGIGTLFSFKAALVPLTKLDGIDIWTEGRLSDEQIGSVQAMANARIELLVLRTHFSTEQIVDWIDQAILYQHAGHDGDLIAGLQGVGKRTAYKLLDAVGGIVGASRSEDLTDRQRETLTRLATAVNTLRKQPGTTEEQAMVLYEICRGMRSEVNMPYIVSFYATLPDTVIEVAPSARPNLAPAAAG